MTNLLLFRLKDANLAFYDGFSTNFDYKWNHPTMKLRAVLHKPVKQKNSITLLNIKGEFWALQVPSPIFV